ncbi:hypothetical protein KEJ44_06710 [Candidatus Bathyarchaeota archaeon]|nr:hypothetical protein [Candidatus Bathyarchaeota archaeon]
MLEGLHNRLTVVLAALTLLLGLLIMVRPLVACSFGCPVSRPPYILVIHNQRVMMIPVATVVFIEFLILVSVYAARTLYKKRVRIKDYGRILMALGISMAPLFTIIGYTIGILILTNGPALYPRVTEGFYGFGYLSVFNGLYEYNPSQAKIWPTPLVFEISGAIFLIGLIVHAAIRRRKEEDKSGSIIKL